MFIIYNCAGLKEWNKTCPPPRYFVGIHRSGFQYILIKSWPDTPASQ